MGWFFQYLLWRILEGHFLKIILVLPSYYPTVKSPLMTVTNEPLSVIVSKVKSKLLLTGLNYLYVWNG